MEIAFGSDDIARFSTKYHGEVRLSKRKWKIICSQPERFYYRHNSEKVGTTLVNPDYVRHHRLEGSQFIYYKAFDSYRLERNIEIPLRKCRFFAVIIDEKTKRICTVYPVAKPKEGKEYNS